jgi:soluble lytic murein transglycosylase-like protein
MDWRWWKAQGISESNLNQAARGSRGEIGIMQLMPSLARALGVDPYDPESNIEGGIRYDRQLWDAWPDAADRRELMFASYNAGIGNVKRAAKAAASTTWALVAHSLAAVTAANAPITVNYVAGIGRLMGTR